MSLNRISFLEGWERNPAAFLNRPDSGTDSEPDDYQDLPDGSVASSFPSTYSRLNFNPYAGPGWNENPDDPHDDRASFLGPSFLGLSPTTTREGRAGSPAPERPVLVDSPWAHTTGAYEVSAAKRIAQVCTAVVYCFLAAGVVFGFAALKPVLIREKVYRNLCSQAELERDVDVCDGQEIRLNLMFTIAAVVTNVSALPVGTILDAYGPRVSSIIGSICLATGAILFGTAKQLSFDGYIPGYLFLALGGPFIFIPSFHLSNTFPKRSGLILSMLTGAFDASSALFLLFRLLNERTDFVSLKNFFAVYLVVPVFIIAMQIFVMPATSYKTAGELAQQAEAQIADEAEDRMDESLDPDESELQRKNRRLRRQSLVSHIQSLLDDTTSVLSIDGPVQNIPIPANPPAPTGVWGVLHGHSALSQIRTPWFILITAFTVLMMLRINYFVATLRSQYNYMLNPHLAKTLNTAFDVLLPIGGLVSVPFIGTFLDVFQTRTVLAILVLTATVIGVLGCIPQLTAAYGNIFLFVLYRPFYYTAVSDYAAKVFGFATFGKVYGLVICLAGIGNFAQAGLDALTLKVWKGDPVPVNIGLTVLVASVGAGLVIFVSWKTREREKEIGERAPLLDGQGRRYGV
ncbi:Major facilitator superfamily domain general substrate transporter [Penicillium brevicompactum]|uniref:Major facilitator superfamily domain general substrate transporter n=1 Tax=Penicillium brevicompactum TaxID=5074 RepID=UPI0025406A60|nr:Major facilitator superfamily domain general substrate transporter [Penicillium brevicompactum]KAJ5325207.1 Major facilitator superfamily domain general substrate transporter [Penicillium brevicompactum]